MARFRGPNDDQFKTWVDMIDVTSSLPYRDPDWKWTDPNGHEHTADGDTFVWIVDEEGGPDGEGGEWPDEGHYECATCGVLVKPGTRGPDMFRRHIPGLHHFAINGIEVSKAEADEWIAAHKLSE